MEAAACSAAVAPPSTKPTLFNGPMVRAILSGRKTQTRRLMKPQPVRVMEHERPLPNSDNWTIRHGRGWKWQPRKDWHAYTSDDAPYAFGQNLGRHCPHGRPGDFLWVRETWGSGDMFSESGHEFDPPQTIIYRADHQARYLGARLDTYAWNFDLVRWRPSIHMPRWASRITLRITDVRVERLQDISEEDAKAEGVRPSDAAVIVSDGHVVPEMANTHRGAFACLWDSINANRATWQSNPWIWAISFERVE